MAKETLYLIDGNAILYRAYFAFIKNPLINSKGMNTSAIYGTISTFLKLVDKYQVKYLAISFDRKGPTFRHEMAETYKANRPPMPDDLIPQIEPVKKFFSLIKVPELDREGYEADDVISSLAKKYKEQYDIVVISGDKDFAQIVEPSIKLYDPYKETFTERGEIEEKYGVKPEQFIDYLAICGDASDNIPGVKGIGPKGAATLLQTYGTLDGIYEHINEITGSTQQKLIDNRENAYLSQTLATIVTDLPVTLPDTETFTFHPTNLKNALSFFSDYELTTIKKRIETQYGGEEPEEELFPGAETAKEVPQIIQTHKSAFTFNPHLINSISEFHDMLSELRKAPYLSLDTETTSTDPLRAELVGISLCFNDKDAYYLPIGHFMHENLPFQKVQTGLQDAMHGKIVVGHNLKYDLMILENRQWKLDNPLFDTMLAAYLLDPGTNSYSLDNCAEREFGYHMQPIKELIGTGKSQTTFDMVPVDKAAFYSGEDAYVTWRLYEIFLKRMKDTHVLNLFEKMEMPLLKVLMQMERNGVHIDVSRLAETSRHIQEQLGRITKRIYEIAGYTFNINSTQQLNKLMFEELKIPTLKKNKTGFSTDISVLEDLAPDHEIARLLIDYRQYTKLESTYIQALPKLINPKTGRVHSSFNQTVASTGRLSSSNPNLQNIPVRSEIGKEIRKAFCAPNDEWAIVSADYSQIELRLLAILSKDPNLVSAFQRNEDIHRDTASRIFGVPIEEVTKVQRGQAKTINFGIIYGMGPVRLSKSLEISQKQAKEFIDHYFNQFPTIREYINNSISFAQSNGFAETISGRRLYLPNITSSNQRLKSEAERIAMNMPLQGSAADIIKIAMINIHEKIREHNWIRMILQVHDELVFEVKKDYLGSAERTIITEMENALPTEYRKLVHLDVDIHHGENWAEAH
ncbi:MAG TPA: DNA polymerase I [Candidatus Cloacimonadota bacterium]|nr:DNA polymerase I [Candidatus Cloacimonadota bacterium]HPT71147.1 DNA polymerase I [Candidatus Cloacimonadota bacterium]